jgi:NAD-dependent SIR2 family protein deacetylase
MGCGKVMGSAVGYRRTCGGFWYGSISKCDECEEKELKRRVLEKQEALLDKELAKK